jgi:hypothetical protein
MRLMLFVRIASLCRRYLRQLQFFSNRQQTVQVTMLLAITKNLFVLFASPRYVCVLLFAPALFFWSCQLEFLNICLSFFASPRSVRVVMFRCVGFICSQLDAPQEERCGRVAAGCSGCGTTSRSCCGTASCSCCGAASDHCERSGSCGASLRRHAAGRLHTESGDKRTTRKA